MLTQIGDCLILQDDTCEMQQSPLCIKETFSVILSNHLVFAFGMVIAY